MSWISFTSTDCCSGIPPPLHGSSEWKVDKNDQTHRIMSLSFPHSPSLISFSHSLIRTHHLLPHTQTLSVTSALSLCFSVIRFGGLLHLCLISTPRFTTQLLTAQSHDTSNTFICVQKPHATQTHTQIRRCINIHDKIHFLRTLEALL